VNIGLLWIPHVAVGQFVVEIELRDEAGTLLDLERSETFSVTSDDLPPDLYIRGPTSYGQAGLPVRDAHPFGLL
jgi:hypothetical protein